MFNVVPLQVPLCCPFSGTLARTISTIVASGFHYRDTKSCEVVFKCCPPQTNELSSPSLLKDLARRKNDVLYSTRSEEDIPLVGDDKNESATMLPKSIL